MIRFFKIFFFLLLLPVFLFAESDKDILLKQIISQFNSRQLKQLCRNYHIETNGNKGILQNRLLKRLGFTNIISEPASVSKRNTDVKASGKKPLIIKHADNVKYFKLHQVKEDVLVITGGVLEYEKIKLKADRIAVNLKTKQVYGSGHVFMTENGKSMAGSGFYYDVRQKYGLVYGGRSVIDKILYSGREIKTLDKDFYKITDARFSTCRLENPHYTLEAKQIWIYPDKTFLLLNLFYSVGGVRLFYLPLAFTTKKGTGIHSYGGYSSADGYFLQNTYKYHFFRSLQGSLRFDYYQFKGGYGGLTVKHDSNKFHTDISMNIAQDSGILDHEKKIRWFHNFSENIMLWKTEKGYTKLSGHFFSASDDLFTHDYLQNRVTRSGIALSSLNLIKKNYEPSLHSQNSYSLILSDIHSPSSFSLVSKWNVRWNPLLQKYVIYNIQLPALRYSLSQNLTDFSLKKGDSFLKKSFVFLFNNIRWSVKADFNNVQYYDFDNETYTKTEIKRDISTGLSKTFNFFSVLTYSPRAAFGSKNKMGKNISASEAYNFSLESYNYIFFSETYRLNLHKFLPVKSLSSYFSLSRNIYYRMLSDIQTEYGDVQSHSAHLGYYFNIPGISYSAKTFVNLLTKTNGILNLQDSSRYNNLEQDLTIKPVSFFSLQDHYSYSIKEHRPVLNLLKLNVNKNKPFAEVFDYVRWNVTYSHNFQNVINSYLTSSFSTKLHFKYFQFTVSAVSKNRKMYVYSKNDLRSLGMDERLYRNILTDLADSFNFFDTEKREHTYFNLNGISISINHNLHCWELVGGYSLTQRQTYYPYDSSIVYPYWEHSLWVQLQLKDFSSVKYKKDIKTEPPEWE